MTAGSRTAAKWKMAVRDGNTREKQKPSEKTEYVTQIQLKKHLHKHPEHLHFLKLCFLLQDCLSKHSENVLLLCFCQDVNSKGRGFYMQGFYT